MIPVYNKKSAGLGGPGWESPGNKLQIPNSKLQRSTKLQAQKPTCAPFAPASVFGVWGLRFGTSLELGVWCLVIRSAAAQQLRYARLGATGWVARGQPDVANRGRRHIFLEHWVLSSTNKT